MVSAIETPVQADNSLDWNPGRVDRSRSRMEKYSGIPQATLSNGRYRDNQLQSLKLPSSKAFRVFEIYRATGGKQKNGTWIKSLWGIGFTGQTQKVVSESAKGDREIGERWNQHLRYIGKMKKISWNYHLISCLGTSEYLVFGGFTTAQKGSLNG